MFVISNISANPLQMTDGKNLAPVGSKGSSAKVKQIGDREKRFQERGLVTIIEEKEKNDSSAAASDKSAGGRK